MANSRFQYVRAYERTAERDALLPGCYAVVRLDGRGFTRFSRLHGFRKPNEPRALRLMDAAAAEVMRAFPEVSLAYGQSDEYSFLLRRAGVPFERRATKLATLFASTFAAAYVRFWPAFFGGDEGSDSSLAAGIARAAGERRRRRRRRRGAGVAGGGEGEGEDEDEDEDAVVPLVSFEPGAFEDEERDAEEGRRAIEAAGMAMGPPEAASSHATTPTPLRSTPAFDARCVEYPTPRTVRDYFAWRQADAHINNQYNTTFWALVQRGADGEGKMSPADAQRRLKGTSTGEKNEIMFQRGINYNALPQRYRKGSVIFWEEEDQEEEGNGGGGGGGGGGGARRRVLALRHCDIIRDDFWLARPEILDEEGDAGDGSGRGLGGRRGGGGDR